MALDLHIKPHPTFLLAVVTGIFGAPEARDALIAIFKQCEVHKLPLLLVDWRTMVLPDPLTTLDQFQIASVLSDQVSQLRGSGIKEIRVAFVNSVSHLKLVRFAETVANNRGTVLKMTTTMPEALVWLGVEPA
jgi:hypothetical protein